MDEPVWAQGWSPEDLPSDEPDADPHGVTPSAKPAALTLSHFGVPQADSNAPKLTRF